MKSKLTFEARRFRVGENGEASNFPDLTPRAESAAELEDRIGNKEVPVGYGKRKTAYPYTRYRTYSRRLKEQEIQVAVLENDHLQAVFLPSLGGRLWSLIEKRTGQNLLYTNDVIRFSNLAICDAWFSGGVEWNIGLIGHSPFTTRPLFTAKLNNNRGNPVLRMYEYERVRSAAYQMDFWLDEDDRFLNCRMRIFNPTGKTIPMYWWSNMAVPQYPGGRVVVPASRAFSSDGRSVFMVDIPLVKGIDVSRYEDIPGQVDYFFDIPADSPKYIANLDRTGHGLLQMSTARQQSRKLFSWGNNAASKNWQDYLTDHAGHYVEIQAGLPKTQYACIPMEPHSTWEWLEQYGAVQAAPEIQAGSFEEARQAMTEVVLAHEKAHPLENLLQETKDMAETPAHVKSHASAYGALYNAVIERLQSENQDCVEAQLPPHLDFATPLFTSANPWKQFLQTGALPKSLPSHEPYDFISDPTLAGWLIESLSEKNAANGNAWYQAGLWYMQTGDYKKANAHFSRSKELSPNARNCHALAVCTLLRNRETEKPLSYPDVSREITEAIRLCENDLGFLKEASGILLAAAGFQEWLSIYEKLPLEARNDGRLRFNAYLAMAATGREKEAYEKLNRETEMFLDDLRECEDSVEELWQSLHRSLYGSDGEVPAYFRFSSVEE